MSFKINDLTNKKRYNSNIKPFSTEKATYLKCWIKSLIVSKYFWKWKEIDFENIWLKRYDLKTIWLWKIMETWKKFALKTKSSLLCHPGVKRPARHPGWRLNASLSCSLGILNAQLFLCNSSAVCSESSILCIIDLRRHKLKIFLDF